MKSLLLAACASIIIAFTSCGDNNRRHAPSDAQRVKITRFDRDIAAYPQLDSTKRAQFRDRYAGVLMMTVGPDTITDEAVATYARGRGVTMFVPDIKEPIYDTGLHRECTHRCVLSSFRETPRNDMERDLRWRVDLQPVDINDRHHNACRA